MGGTNSLHPNAAASQRGPDPPAPAGLGEGQSTGAWDPGRDTWGHKREETSCDTAGDIRVLKVRHRKRHSSRYRRRRYSRYRKQIGLGMTLGGRVSILGENLEKQLWGTHMEQ